MTKTYSSMQKEFLELQELVLPALYTFKDGPSVFRDASAYFKTMAEMFEDKRQEIRDGAKIVARRRSFLILDNINDMKFINSHHVKIMALPAEESGVDLYKIGVEIDGQLTTFKFDLEFVQKIAVQFQLVMPLYDKIEEIMYEKNHLRGGAYRTNAYGKEIPVNRKPPHRYNSRNRR